jgi:hypothetical protein
VCEKAFFTISAPLQRQEKHRPIKKRTRNPLVSAAAGATAKAASKAKAKILIFVIMVVNFPKFIIRLRWRSSGQTKIVRTLIGVERVFECKDISLRDHLATGMLSMPPCQRTSHLSFLSRDGVFDYVSGCLHGLTPNDARYSGHHRCEDTTV